jgi:hypothetical protein
MLPNTLVSTVDKFPNDWVKRFLAGYVPDKTVDIDFAKITARLVAKETTDGCKDLTKDYALAFCPPDIFLYAVRQAIGWAIPISQLGLLYLTLGCHSRQHVRMLLAVVLKTWVAQKGGNNDFIDVLTVSEILQGGTVSEDYFSKMWNEEGGKLLDYVEASDFL